MPRDRVSVGSAARDFLLPIPDIEELTGMDLHQFFGEPEDDSVDSLIRELNVELRSVPRPAVARAYSEPRTRPEPAFDIDIPLDLLVDANPMVR